MGCGIGACLACACKIKSGMIGNIVKYVRMVLFLGEEVDLMGNANNTNLL